MIHELFKLFNWAGSEWVLGILGLLSVLVVAISMARYLELAKLAGKSNKFWNEIGDQWITGDMTGDWRASLDETKQKYPCLETEALEVVAKAEKNGGDPDKMMTAYLEHRKQKLEKYVGLVGTVGANAAFVGLLGTVLGIIRAFHQMSVSGVGGMDTIGSGIAEALVATAVGLFVAIPAVVFYNVLNRKISTLLRRAESVAALAEAGESKWQAN